MLELRRSVLMRLRQGDPSLDPVSAVRLRARLGGRSLRMRDAAPRHHPIDVAGTNDLVRSHAVPVLNLAKQEIRDGREPDMGVGTHVGSLPRGDVRRSKMVKEDERTDHLALLGGKGATHLEAAEIDRAWHDQRFDGVEADSVGISGLKQRVPAHGWPPAMMKLLRRRLFSSRG